MVSLQAFVQTHPSWLNHGVTQFAPEDPDWPVLWVLSRDADRAFTTWAKQTGAL